MSRSLAEFDELTKEVLPMTVQKQIEAVQESPITILQFGEGNFLRGFVDWMVHECRKQGLYEGSIVITQPRPSGSAKLMQLKRQDGLYTLVVRGLEQGVPVLRSEVITAIRELVDPYETWGAFLNLATIPTLKVVVSNTTEAGLVYTPTPYQPGVCPTSFPARLTLFLFHRFRSFQGDPQKGLICLPCELIDRNGDRLRECVLQHAADWDLPLEFVEWVRSHNQFLNSLVDRIVTGYPTAEAAEWAEKLGYNDALLNTAEPYYLWAIQADEALNQVLPFAEAGLNVHFVQDLDPYQVRKVRILNGLHTVMAPMGLLRGVNTVRAFVEDESLGMWLKTVLNDEIIPAVPLDRDELTTYAAAVWERFCNPYIQHQLSDIAMNSISKFRVRVLPTLVSSVRLNGVLPPGLLQAFAALIRLYRVTPSAKGYQTNTTAGVPMYLRDDEPVLRTFALRWDAHIRHELDSTDFIRVLLSDSALWGQDLSGLDGLVDALSDAVQAMVD